ncbi:MAG: HU family DNA-binding protein [Candidatus Bipolaricaulia bacterium]
MNKGELIDRLYQQTSSTKAQVREVIDSFIDTVQAEVARGGKVQLVNFGTFEQAHRKATTKRNPQTGQRIRVPAKVVPRFRAGKGFEERVRRGR